MTRDYREKHVCNAGFMSGQYSSKPSHAIVRTPFLEGVAIGGEFSSDTQMPKKRSRSSDPAAVLGLKYRVMVVRLSQVQVILVVVSGS